MVHSGSSSSPYHYLRLDLGETRQIMAVHITNRRDCCDTRMWDGQIFAGDGATPELNTLCSSASDSGTYNCDTVISGRYVFLQV